MRRRPRVAPFLETTSRGQSGRNAGSTALQLAPGEWLKTPADLAGMVSRGETVGAVKVDRSRHGGKQDRWSIALTRMGLGPFPVGAILLLVSVAIARPARSQDAAPRVLPELRADAIVAHATAVQLGAGAFYSLTGNFWLGADL